MGQAAPIFLGIAALGQGIAGLIGAKGQADAMREQAEYNKQMGELNAKMYERQAGEVMTAGEDEAARLGTHIKQVIGAQRAGAAASGVDVGSGSAAAGQAETRQFGDLDMMQITNNAWRQAWGLRAQATQERLTTLYGEKAADTAANQTILTAGLNMGVSVVKAAGEFGQYGVRGADGMKTPVRSPVASYGGTFGKPRYY